MPYAVFSRQSAGGAAPEASRERLKNWFGEPFPDGATARLTLLPSAGLSPMAEGFGGPVRAIYTQGGLLYVAAGGFLWSVTAAGVKTSLGTINESAGTTIAGNGFDVAVAAGGKYYVWNGSSFGTPSSGAFQDVGSVSATAGYIVLFEQYGQRFSVSALNDASTFDALDFASAEANPDGIVRGGVDHGDIWISGTGTIEIWTNTGADFPFQRYSGGVFEVGVAWPNSVTASDNGVWFVGDDRIVYRAAAGAAPARMSTSKVETVLAAIGADEDVRMFEFDDRGHKLICVRLESGPAWVYDLATGLWHERNSGVGEGPWIGTCATMFDGKQVVGGADGGVHRLGGLTDGGKVIEREAISIPIDANGEYLTLSQVKLHFGHGRTDLGRVPLSMISVSRDGVTWDRERELKMGKIGEYGFQCWVNGLGRAYGFTMRVKITDEIDAPLIGVSYKAAV